MQISSYSEFLHAPETIKITPNMWKLPLIFILAFSTEKFSAQSPRFFPSLPKFSIPLIAAPKKVKNVVKNPFIGATQSLEIPDLAVPFPPPIRVRFEPASPNHQFSKMSSSERARLYEGRWRRRRRWIRGTATADCYRINPAPVMRSNDKGRGAGTKRRRGGDHHHH